MPLAFRRTSRTYSPVLHPLWQIHLNMPLLTRILLTDLHILHHLRLLDILPQTRTPGLRPNFNLKFLRLDCRILAEFLSYRFPELGLPRLELAGDLVLRGVGAAHLHKTRGAKRGKGAIVFLRDGVEGCLPIRVAATEGGIFDSGKGGGIFLAAHPFCEAGGIIWRFCWGVRLWIGM
jgi:hypothetical protein